MREIAEREASFIKSINFLANGSIEIVAVIGSGCEGTVRGVDLCIPSDLDFNSANVLYTNPPTVTLEEPMVDIEVLNADVIDDSLMRGMLYNAPIGTQIVNSINKSTDYYNTSFVEWKDQLIWGYVPSGGASYYICKYNKITHEVTYKLIPTLKSNTFTARPQIINDELYFITCAENIYVLDIDFNEVRREATTRTVSQSSSVAYCEIYITFIHNGYVYNIDNLNTTSKYVKYSRTPLVRSGKTDYIAPKSISYTDLDIVKKIFYGVWIEGTTCIQSIDGVIYDIADFDSITHIDNWVSKGKVEDKPPIGLLKPYKMSDGTWVGVHCSAHDINRLSGLHTANVLPKHFCNNIAYPNITKYVTMCNGGNCLTHVTLSTPIEKTTSNELVLTYVLK